MVTFTNVGKMLFNNRMTDSNCTQPSENHVVVPKSGNRAPLKYEQLVAWAVEQWQATYGETAYRVVWAGESPAYDNALSRIKVGRKIGSKTRYGGYRPLSCPHSISISHLHNTSRTAQLIGSVGAYAFRFEQGTRSFEVIFVSAHHVESLFMHGTVAIALVPADALKVWADFEALCNRYAYRLERSEKVYIIGGSEKAFEPTVAWDDVILPQSLKDSLRSEVETFFKGGAAIYKQLNLPPFRKLLLVGPPGTGKSMLCAALAKIALDMKCLVIYISSADQEGATFDKVQRALYTATHSQHPVVIVLEELDAYLREEDKSQILNVLDGFEAPNNRRGALLLATTNYPEVIDQRIAKRPGRVDRVIYIPEIQDAGQAEQLLRRYMGAQWQDAYRDTLSSLVGQTGAFVREVALYARMLALNSQAEMVSLDMLKQSIQTLTRQVSASESFAPRRPIGFPHPNSTASQESA